MPGIDHLTIANRACAMFGDAPLGSLDEDTIGGQSVALLYDSLLGFCLGLIPWTFLRQSVALNRLTSVTPINGHAYAHQLPSGFAASRVRLLASQDPDDVITAFEIEGDQLHCDTLQVYAQMTAEASPALWSGSFTHAFTKALAGELAQARADDNKLAAQLKEEAFGPPSMNGRGGLMGAAINADGRTAPVRRLPAANPLLDAWVS